MDLDKLEQKYRTKVENYNIAIVFFVDVLKNYGHNDVRTYDCFTPAMLKAIREVILPDMRKNFISADIELKSYISKKYLGREIKEFKYES